MFQSFHFSIMPTTCPHNPIIKTHLKKELTIQVKSQFSSTSKKILMLRNDLIWDMCFVFPTLLYMKDLWLHVDVMTGPRNTKLFNVLFSYQTAIKEKHVNIHHEDFVWYRQEKKSYRLRAYLGTKYILNGDFFTLRRTFWHYDVIVDFVGKRRYQIVMFLVKWTKKLFWLQTFVYGIYKSLTNKLLEWYFGFADNSNVMDHYLAFAHSIIPNKDKDIKEFKKHYAEIIQTVWLHPTAEDYILVHPGYGWEASRKRQTHKRIELIRKLYQQWEKIKLIYWPMEKEQWEAIAQEITKLDWIEVPSTKDLKYAVDLIAHCKYYIGIDSWFGHVADILLKPGILLFSRENADRLWGRNQGLKTICNYKPICLKRNCPFDYCMNLISVEDVMRKLEL